jgi:hypothetical protein
MKAARAEARAKREAEKAAWLRHVTLVAEVRRLSLEAVKASIRDRGDRITLHTYAQLRAQADAMVGPCSPGERLLQFAALLLCRLIEIALAEIAFFKCPSEPNLHAGGNDDVSIRFFL